MIFQCPGSQNFKQPKPEIIKCPFCSGDVEIWTDEAEAACQKCKSAVARGSTQSCLDWCKYAKECIGEEKYKALQDKFDLKLITTPEKDLKKMLGNK